MDTSPQAGPGGGPHRNGLSLGPTSPATPLLDPLPKAETQLPPASEPVAELWFLCCPSLKVCACVLCACVVCVCVVCIHSWVGGWPGREARKEGFPPPLPGQ